MNDISTLKALTLSTKVFIIINEYEARLMPMFQLRAVLEIITSNDEEKKVVIDMVESELRTRGHSADKITSFLSELVLTPSRTMAPSEANMRGTRQVRSPFAMSFESTPPGGNTMLRGKISGGAPIIPVMPSISDGPPPPPDSPLPPPDPVASETPAEPKREPAPTAQPFPQVAPPARPTVRRNTFMFESGAPSQISAGPPQPRATVVIGPKPVPAIPPESAPPEKTMRPILASGVIVLADDDPRARMFFRMRIEQAGYTVVECSDGAEAWTRLQQGDVAAIVTDMKMPNLHGLELLKRISETMHGLPVVICSAYDQLQDELIVQTYPRLKYLVKPIAAEKLIEAIRELLADGVKS